MPTILNRTLPSALTAITTAALVACGGGGGSDNPPEEPVRTTLAGQVIVNGPVRNAVVCLDINSNGACDATEPTAAKTAADGRYQMTLDSAAAEQSARASLLALMVPGTADDGRADRCADPSPGDGGELSGLGTEVLERALDLR